MNETTDSGNDLVTSEVGVVVETVPQQEEKKMELTEIQHNVTSRQVALLEDDHKRSVSRLYNLTGVFKKPPGKNQRNFLKMIKVFCDEHKSELFIQTLPSLTERILGPFLVYGVNSRNLFVNLQAPHDPNQMKSPVFVVPHFIKAPEFNKSGMPEMISSALVQSINSQQQFLNADVLFLSQKKRQQMKPQQKCMTESCEDWMENHTDMELENLQITEKSVPHDRCVAASGLMLCTEVPEDLTQDGTQVCAQESESQSGSSMQKDDQGKSTNPESSDLGPQKEEPSVKGAALQQCDPNSNTPGQHEGKIQSSGNLFSPEEKDSFLKEIFQHSWTDTAADTEEPMQEDIYVDHQVMQIPFLQYTDQSENAFYPQISQTQIRSDHSIPDDAKCTLEKAGLMLEEETICTQPFEPSETAVCVNEMEEDETSVLQGNEISEAFIPEDTRSNSLEKVQKIAKLGGSQDLILISNDVITPKPCKEMANTHGETARFSVLKESVALPEEDSLTKVVAIKSYDDKYTIDPLRYTQADGNGHSPKVYDVLQGPKSGKMGHSLEMMATTMDEQIKQAQGLSQIQKEPGAVESFNPCVSKQKASPCLDNCQVQKHNDQNFSVAATTSQGKMEEGEAAVTYNYCMMTGEDNKVKAFPNLGAKPNDISMTKVVHSSLPVFESSPDSSQKQHDLTKLATAEVQKGIELNAGQNQLMECDTSKIQSNTQETSLQPKAEKLPVNSSSTTSNDCMSVVTSTQNSPQMNSTAQRCTLHEMGAALVEKETPVQLPLSFIPVSTAAPETSAFAGRSSQKFVYRPLHHYSYTSPATGTDQTVPGNQDMEGGSSTAETTLYEENGQQDGSRRTDGYFKWKYVPSARIDEVMRTEEDNGPPSLQSCDMSSRRPRRIGLSRCQSVKPLHKSAHRP